MKFELEANVTYLKFYKINGQKIKAPAAKRLDNTKQMNYWQLIEVRKQGIDSSDAATVCGLNPYMSMLELWMIKTRRILKNTADESVSYAPLLAMYLIWHST